VTYRSAFYVTVWLGYASGVVDIDDVTLTVEPQTALNQTMPWVGDLPLSGAVHTVHRGGGANLHSKVHSRADKVHFN
jgi:hypothetical protein